MKTRYFTEEKVYLISNHAVARNPIFLSKGVQSHFINKMEKYLNPLGDILGYKLHDHEFQILIRLKSRTEFESYYGEKYGDKKGVIIPPSTYMFSQAMANLQVSLVKFFNIRYNRTGGMMASRFDREPIENEEHLRQILEDMNNGEFRHTYSGIWISELSGRVQMMGIVGGLEELMEKYDLDFSSQERMNKTDLVGRSYLSYYNPQFYPIYYHQNRLFKAINKYLE